MRPENAKATFSPNPWRILDLVIVYRLGDGWSTWRWREGGEWTDGAYPNIERLWARTAIGWDTEDLTLDVGPVDPHQHRPSDVVATVAGVMLPFDKLRARTRLKGYRALSRSKG